MAFDDSRTRLAHIVDAVEWIERMTADFVERNLERISEASRHLPDAMKDQHPSLPWRDIAAIGNRLRHGHGSIDDGIIWRIVTLELPALHAAVRDLLQRSGDGP